MNTFRKPLFIHWFYYISAIVSYGIAFLLLTIHYYEQNLKVSIPCYFLMGLCLTYPHIVFLVQYLKTGFNEKHERYCMLLDAGLSGIFGNFIAIFSMPSLLFYMLTMTNIMLGHGLSVFLRGVALSFFNLLVIGFWVNFKFFTEVSFVLSATSGILTLLYPIYLAYVIHFRTGSLKRSKSKLKIQKIEIQEINEELNQLNEELAVTIETVSEQKEQIQKQNTDVTQSVKYAKRIQEAVMPSISYVEKILPESFILYKPRDVVSGDFYFVTEHQNKIFIAAVDCTGHGIPGAFMSLLGNDLLTEIIISKDIVEVDIILNKLNEGIRKILRQEETKNNDGMDIALVVIDKTTKTISFAGAKNPLFYIQNGVLQHIKGDNKHIGGEQRGGNLFTKHTIDLDNTPIFLYLTSDGYQDQFGGQYCKKFSVKKLKDTLFSIYQKPLFEQQKILDKTIEDWKNEANETQIDDILIIGLKITL